ncbi:MAG: type II toxin-antitoxin system VapC family toxin [Patescibacteria group bacterium]
MEILVDSDIIIDFLNNQSSAVNLLKDSFNNKEFFISIISWIEVVYGFKKNKASNKIKIFQDLLKDYRIQVISVDEKVAEKFLDVKIGLEKQRQPLADFDLLITATAIVNNLSLVTRNTKHFKRITGLDLF